MPIVVKIMAFIAIAFCGLLALRVAGFHLSWWLVTAPLWVYPAILIIIAIAFKVLGIGRMDSRPE